MSTQSLKKTRRLRSSREFKRFFDSSETFRLSECTIYRVKNTLGHFRLGITLKARGTSIQRNRIKRQIRESFRKHASRLGSYDYNVVIPQSKKMAHPFAEKLGDTLRVELKRLFK